jgi:hypothetical protein
MLTNNCRNYRSTPTAFAICLISAATAAMLSAPPAQAQAPSVPASYQDLYTQTTNYLNAFSSMLNSQWSGSKYPYLPTGNLLNADANAGPQLINPGYQPGVLLELQALKALGVQAVAVEVGFPMLYQPFLEAQGQPYGQYVAFYRQVAGEVRAAGLKLWSKTTSC